MDEDSLLWSPIEYNIFEFMSERRIEYGFRMAAWEHGYGKQGFHKLVEHYVVEGNHSTGWLLDECPDGRRSIDKYTLSNCGGAQHQPSKPRCVIRIGIEP